MLLKKYQTQINQALEHYLPSSNTLPQQLHTAMRYSVLGGGKRVRPALCYATGEAFGIPLAQLDAAAVAVELIHAYSLIHDDLPAMDDDDLRRNRPTCHKAYGEATAILAGDGLQALAFQVLAESTVPSAEIKIRMIQILSKACSSSGMVGGQAIDIESQQQSLSLSELTHMHQCKTGALIQAAVLLGALHVDTIRQVQLEALANYAMHIGLAFQIRDDILDVIADTQTLGKTQGADHALDKPTYVSLLGLDGAKQKAADVHRAALKSLQQVDANTEQLANIANYIVERLY